MDLPLGKRLVWACGLTPAAMLVLGGLRGELGVDPTNYLLHTTGLLALLALTLSLVVTPLRRLTGWGWLVGLRRGLGLLAFAYAAAHLALYVVLDRDGSVASAVAEIAARPYLLIGAVGVLAMLPLALTSTDRLIARLGARAWKRLHRLAYVAAIAGVAHFYLLVKSDVTRPRLFAIGLGGLLLARVGLWGLDTRRAAQRRRTRLAAPRFFRGELRVAEVIVEAGGARTFRLVAPDGGPLPFVHQPGQYLTLTTTIGDRQVRRSYTLASSPTQRDRVEITVKRKADGWVSGHLHDTLTVGGFLHVAAPAGRFGCTEAGPLAAAPGAPAPRAVLLIAGGVGITPMMSVIRYLTARGWPGTLHLLYAVRTSADVIFGDELRALAAAHPGLRVTITVSGDDPTWNGARGRITPALIADAVPDLAGVPALLCGPDAMMAATRAMLRELGVPDAAIHEEAFVSPADDDAAATLDAAPAAPASLAFQRSGRRVELPMATTLLDAAEAAGVDLPSECRSGVCGQCKTRVLSGPTVGGTGGPLSAAERARGLVLACQAQPRGDVVIDA